MNDIQESQLLLQCLQALNPAWKQKDFQGALHKSQSCISDAQNGNRALAPTVRELARRLIQDRIAEIAGEDFSYKQITEIAAWFERLYAEPEFFTKEKDLQLQDNRAYQVAFKIFTSGYWIV